MASMVLSSVGSAFGGALGGIVGGYLGGYIDRLLFAPDAPKSYGPRLNDLTVQTSTEGASLPIVYGTMRIAGNVIWSTGLEETATTTEAGGGSGGDGPSSTTYSYKTDAAVAVCEGTITGIRRIWADTKLIYDVGLNNDDYVVLLMQGDSFTDTTKFSTPQKLGDTTISSSRLSFDGAGDYIQVPTNTRYYIGLNDFSIEFNININDTSNRYGIVGQNNSSGTAASSSFQVAGLNGSIDFYLYYTDSTFTKLSSSIVAGTSYEFAFCRKDNSIFLLRDGIIVANTTITKKTVYSSTNNIGIGCIGEYTSQAANTTYGTLMNGYLWGIRFTNGYSMYTGNYTITTNPISYSPSSMEVLTASGQHNIRIYIGSETQLCDPLIQSIEGTDLAFRGTAYVVFEDLELANYGNRLPNFSFEVVKSGSTSSLVLESQYISHNYVTNNYDMESYISQHYNSSTNTHYLVTLDSSPIISDSCNLIAKFYINNTNNTSNSLIATISTTAYKTMLFWPGQIPYRIVPGYNVDEPCLVCTTSYSGGSENYKTIHIIYMDRSISIRMNGLAGETNQSVYTQRYYIKNNFIYIVIGYNYNSNNYTSYPGTLKLYKINLKTQTIEDINPPVVVNIWNNITSLLVSDTRIMFTAQTSNGSPLSYIELDINSFTEQKNIVLGSYGTGNMTYYFSTHNPTLSLDGKYIYWYYSNAGGWVARIDLDNFNNNTQYQVMYSLPTGAYQVYGGYGGYIFETNNIVAMYSVAPYNYNMDGLYIYSKNRIHLGTQTVKEVVEDIVSRTDIPSNKYDFSALSSDIVRGYVVSRVMSGGAALDSLQITYNFENIEEAGKIIAKKKVSNINQINLNSNLIGAEQK